MAALQIHRFAASLSVVVNQYFMLKQPTFNDVHEQRHSRAEEGEGRHAPSPFGTIPAAARAERFTLRYIVRSGASVSLALSATEPPNRTSPWAPHRLVVPGGRKAGAALASRRCAPPYGVLFGPCSPHRASVGGEACGIATFGLVSAARLGNLRASASFCQVGGAYTSQGGLYPNLIYL